MSAITIERCSAERAHALTQELAALLANVVQAGASVGFMLPLPEAVALTYWNGIAADVARGTRLLFVALAQDALVGTVQIELAQKPNATHRAEVQKLLVHTSVRRQGIGGTLLRSAHDAALAAGRTLLVLDTRQGDPAEQLYLANGYTRVGSIPQYARDPDGPLSGTTFFYRLLEA